MQGLKGIITDSCIWATDTRYLNDQTELKHAFNFVKHQIVERIDRNPAAQKQFEKHWHHADRRLEKNVFVASFSYDGDDLGQWRGYCPGGSGVSLGFDSAELSAFLLGSRNDDDADTEFDEALIPSRGLMKCVYSDEEKLSLTREAIDCYTQSLLQDGADWDRAFSILSSTLAICAPLFKDRAFKAEREWRLVISTDSPGFPARCFRINNSMLIPYIVLNFAEVKKGYVRKLIVGPTQNPELSLESAQGLLIAHGHEACVMKSTIPYRHW